MTKQYPIYDYDVLPAGYYDAVYHRGRGIQSGNLGLDLLIAT